MVTQEDKTKVAIYGTNFITPSLVNLVKNTNLISDPSKVLENFSGAANPASAAFFGGLDIIGRLSPTIKESKFYRLPQLVGAAYFTYQTISDVLSIANGEYQSFTNLPFDASMAYQLGKDTIRNYRGEDLLEDLTEW